MCEDNIMAKVVSSLTSALSSYILQVVMGPVSYLGPAAPIRYMAMTLSRIQLGRPDTRDDTTLAMI